MKSGTLIFFFLLTLNCGAQTYNSSHTIYLPQEIKEDVQRSIIIQENFILIKSFQGNVNVDNQAWQIHKRWEDDENQIFHLISLDESHSIRMLIKKEKLQHIKVLQPTGDGRIQRVHLVLEKLQWLLFYGTLFRISIGLYSYLFYHCRFFSFIPPLFAKWQNLSNLPDAHWRSISKYRVRKKIRIKGINKSP